MKKYQSIGSGCSWRGMDFQVVLSHHSEENLTTKPLYRISYSIYPIFASQSHDFILNMDETSVQFDIPPRWTYDFRGCSTTRILTSGLEKKCFTVVLTVSASGVMLMPYVIHKLKNPPQDANHPNLVISANSHGWMTSDILQDWYAKVVIPYYNRLAVDAPLFSSWIQLLRTTARKKRLAPVSFLFPKGTLVPFNPWTYPWWNLSSRIYVAIGHHLLSSR